MAKWSKVTYEVVAYEIASIALNRREGEALEAWLRAVAKDDASAYLHRKAASALAQQNRLNESGPMKCGKRRKMLWNLCCESAIPNSLSILEMVLFTDRKSISTFGIRSSAPGNAVPSNSISPSQNGLG